MGTTRPLCWRALRAEVPYVALVASRNRGTAVVQALDVDDVLAKRCTHRAGLDIGACTAPEMALSILAEIVAERRGSAPTSVAAPEPLLATGTASDPVCGMSVAAVDASLLVDTGSGRVYFCGSGCRAAYLDNPAAYA